MEKIPNWAVSRMDLLVAKEEVHPRLTRVGAAFARYITKYEQPPIDPLLKEARKLVAARPNTEYYRPSILAGSHDDCHAVQNALIALRRGVELGKDL